MKEFIMVEDQEAGKFLKLTEASNGDYGFYWVFYPENASVIPYSEATADMLESFGLSGYEYVWHSCNQDGEFI